MKLESPAFENGEMIPAKYTCDGENIVPPFEISDVPENAKSLAIVCDDPDSPSGTWVHWATWNISPSTAGIPEGEAFTGVSGESVVEGETSFGSRGYGGPCPGSGTHRYFFKLYALDAILPLSENSKKQDLEAAMQGHVLAEAELMGTYSRRK